MEEEFTEKSPEVYKNLGNEEFKKKNYLKAIENYSKAIGFILFLNFLLLFFIRFE